MRQSKGQVSQEIENESSNHRVLAVQFTELWIKSRAEGNGQPTSLETRHIVLFLSSSLGRSKS